jgi:hypothetical protein
MKTAIIALSLIANLALGAVWLWRTPSAAPAPAATTAPSSAATPATTAPVPPTASAALAPQNWTQLNTTNDAEFVARLRAEGFPPHLMRMLAYQRVRERHAEAYRKFQPSADYPYWRRSMFQFDTMTPEERRGRRELDRQVGEEVRQLLGENADPASEYQRANRARLYGDLPVEKIDQLTAINADYGDISRMLREKTAGITLPEDREQLAAVERERRADLAKVLSPEELREYDLRSSPSANQVRNRLRYFEPTEEEYRALTALQLDFDATFPPNIGPSQELQRRRSEGMAEFNAQVKALLPPDRYAEYEIKTDSAYGQIARTVAEHNPSADPVAVMTVQRDLAQRFNALRNNRDLPAATRNAQLDALAAEANARMGEVLGPNALKAFKSVGSPINSLLNRPPPKP